MIKFQQSQALTSHFESFWSIVHFDQLIVYNLFSLQSSKKDKKIEKKLKEFYVKALQDFFFENQCLIPMSFFQLPLQGMFTLSAVCLQFHVKTILL